MEQLKKGNLIEEIFHNPSNRIYTEKKKELIYQLLYDLMEFVKPSLYNHEDLTTYSSLPTHEAITLNIVKNYENCIGIEIPIWKPIGLELFLTGHPDILLIWNNIIIIADYKPSQLTSKGLLRRKFFHSLPQICCYGILFKRKFDINNLICITFNQFKAWVYEPESLLRKLNYLLLKYNKNIKIPWITHIE